MRYFIKTLLLAVLTSIVLYSCREDKPQPRKVDYLDGKTFAGTLGILGSSSGFSSSSELRFKDGHFTWSNEYTSIVTQGDRRTREQYKDAITGQYTYEQGVLTLNVKADKESELLTIIRRSLAIDRQLNSRDEVRIAVDEKTPKLTIVATKAGGVLEMPLKR